MAILLDLAKSSRSREIELLGKRGRVHSRAKRMLLAGLLGYGFFVLVRLSMGMAGEDVTFGIRIAPGGAAALLAALGTLVVAVHLVLWTVSRANLSDTDMAAHVYVPEWVAWVAGTGAVLIALGSIAPAGGSGLGLPEFAVVLVSACVVGLAADTHLMVPSSALHLMETSIAGQRRRELRHAIDIHWSKVQRAGLPAPVQVALTGAIVFLLPAAVLFLEDRHANEWGLGLALVSLASTAMGLFVAYVVSVGWVLREWENATIVFLTAVMLYLAILLALVQAVFEDPGSPAGWIALTLGCWILVIPLFAGLVGVFHGGSSGYIRRLSPTFLGARVYLLMHKRIDHLDKLLSEADQSWIDRKGVGRWARWRRRMTGRNGLAGELDPNSHTSSSALPS